jgi:hypothetical protein
MTSARSSRLARSAGMRGAFIAVAAVLVLTGVTPGREASASTLYALTASNTLLQFDSASPGTITSSVAITGLQSGTERVIGIDFRPRTGQLFAVTVPIGVAANALLRTYTVNPLTGAAAFVGSIPNTVPGAADVASGLDFNPTVDRIRIVNVNDENFRVNPNNGALAGDDPNLNPAGSQIVAEAYDRNWDRAVATTIPTTLYGISRATSALVTQGGINGAAAGGANGGLIAAVGALGVTLTAGSDAGFDIAAGGTAYAALTVGGVTGLYTVNLGSGAATLVGSIGNGATQVTGLTVAPRSLVIVGAGPGGGPHVRVFDAGTGLQIPGPLGSFFAYDPAFTGGVRVALGDVNGDGVLDVITAAGPGGGPHVRVLDGRSGAEIAGPLGSFFAFTPAFSGGVNVAVGDVNGDGFQDVIVAADAGGGPHVRVLSGLNGGELASFIAYHPAFTGGVRVAAADLNLDGRAEILTAPGPGGGPHIRIFDNTGNPFATSGGLLNSFFAYDAGFTGGVFVAAGDVNGDAIPDIITGAGAGGGPHVKAFSGKDGSLIASFFAYDVAFTGGVRVAAGDVSGDAVADIITAAGPGGGPHVRAFDGKTSLQLPGPLSSFFPFLPGFTGGVYVGGGRR